jgi:hypothetical protein
MRHATESPGTSDASCRGASQRYSKILLHRVRAMGSNRTVRFRSTHQLDVGDKCAQHGIVRHYTMTAAQMRSNREKSDLEKRVSKTRTTQNYANSTCSRPLGGRRHPLICTDYGHLYEFQRAQTARFATDGYAPMYSFWCPACENTKEEHHGVRCHPWALGH